MEMRSQRPRKQTLVILTRKIDQSTKQADSELLYKHYCHRINNFFGELMTLCAPTALLRRQVLTVRNCASSHKIDYIAKGRTLYQIIGLKIPAILLK